MARRLARVAVMFALCGACSSLPLLDPQHFSLGLRVLPLPFALLWLLLDWGRRRAISAAMAIVLVWYVALFVTAGVAGWTSLPVAVAVGGMIGGLGVALSAGVSDRHLLHPQKLAGAAAIGFLATLVFAVPGDNGLKWKLGFAVWQGAIGAYLYGVSHRFHGTSSAKPRPIG